MPDDATFHEVIRADPAADGPRLRYADYLDEKGDPAGADRAEFIRVQCAVAAAGPDGPVTIDLCVREGELLSAHWPEWLKPACQALAEPMPVHARRGSSLRDGYSLESAPTPGRPTGPWFVRHSSYTAPSHFHSGQFRRGFLAHVALVHKPYRSATHVARLFEKAPLDGLTLALYPETAVAATLAAIDATRLRHLELVTVPSEAVRAVAGCAALAGVRDLVVIGARGDADVADVLGAPGVLPGLRSLVLHGCTIGDLGLERLARAPFVGRLEHLELVGCGLTDDAAIALTSVFPAAGGGGKMTLRIDSMTEAGDRLLSDHFGSSLTLRATGRPWPVRYYHGPGDYDRA